MPHIFLPDQTSEDGGALPIQSSCPLSAVLLIGKWLRWAGPCWAVGMGWVEDLGAEPRNVGPENFVSRKIFRRLTSRLAAGLPAVAISEERGTGNDFPADSGSGRLKGCCSCQCAFKIGRSSVFCRQLAGDSGCENRPQAGSYPQARLS